MLTGSSKLRQSAAFTRHARHLPGMTHNADEERRVRGTAQRREENIKAVVASKRECEVRQGSPDQADQNHRLSAHLPNLMQCTLNTGDRWLHAVVGI